MFNLFNKKRKDFTARVNNSGIEFSIKKGKNLLTAALEKNIQWPHKCRVGSCGSCKYKLIKGKISPDIDFSYVLSFEELNDGYALACQSSLRSDIEIEVTLKNNRREK